MQEYGKVFSEVYAKRWVQFTAYMAPMLHQYYETTEIAAHSKQILDLCCGTGQLCHYFLHHGYTAVGVDRSPHMLQHAKELNRNDIETGKAQFVQADVADYILQTPCGLAVSVFDSLNHLDNIEQLASCFTHIHQGLLPGGLFIFDLNTPEGLKRWTGVEVQEDEEITLIKRGIYTEGMEKAYTQISGFIRREDTRYERFSEVFYNTAFALSDVQAALQASGFTSIKIVSGKNLEQSLEHPEKAGRAVFIVQREGKSR